MPVPEGLKIKVVETTNKQAWMVLPPKPDDAKIEESAERLAHFFRVGGYGRCKELIFERTTGTWVGWWRGMGMRSQATFVLLPPPGVKLRHRIQWFCCVGINSR